MTKPRSPRPVESFGPEIFQALVEGSKRKIELELPYDKAIYFRLRVNQLRHQMRSQGHPLYSVASQAKVTISWPEGTHIRKSSKGVRIPVDPKTLVRLTIAPADSEFAEALSKVGVNVPTLSPDTIVSHPIDDDILAEFIKK